MRRLVIHKNIPVSVTKLTLGLRVGLIISHLSADKLFPVNPRAITGPPKMNLLLEEQSLPALIVKPRLTLVTHTDDLGLYITSNQQGQMFVQNRNKIVRKLNFAPGQILYCTCDFIPVGLMFQVNFPTNRQLTLCYLCVLYYKHQIVYGFSLSSFLCLPEASASGCGE